MTDIAFSIVIPAYNEADNLEPVVSETLATLNGQPWIESYELVLVDDGSADGTGAVADRLAAAHPQVRVIHHPSNRGFGAALRTGFAATRGRYVSLLSADGEIGADQAVALLKDIGDADVCVGRRERAVGAYRETITFCMNVIMRILLGFVPETTGIYVVRGAMLRRMELRSNTGVTNLEVLLHCRHWGGTVRWGVTNTRPRLSGESKVMNTRTMLKTFWEIFLLRLSLRRDHGRFSRPGGV